MKTENLLRPTAMTKPERASRWRPDLLIPLALAMILGATPPVHAGQNSSSQPGPFAGIGISAPALSLINDLVSADRTNFFVYQDSDSGFNHGFPSGFFPGGPVLSKIHLDTACVYDPASANGCTTDTTRLDRVRGTVMRVTFDPLVPGEFVGSTLKSRRTLEPIPGA